MGRIGSTSFDELSGLFARWRRCVLVPPGFCDAEEEWREQIDANVCLLRRGTKTVPVVHCKLARLATPVHGSHQCHPRSAAPPLQQNHGVTEPKLQLMARKKLVNNTYYFFNVSEFPDEEAALSARLSKTSSCYIGKLRCANHLRCAHTRNRVPDGMPVLQQFRSRIGVAST